MRDGTQKIRLRFLRFIGRHGRARIEDGPAGTVLRAASGVELAVTKSAIGRALSDGLAAREGGWLVLLPEGQALLSRSGRSGGGAGRPGDCELEARRDLERGGSLMLVNSCESPLARLRKRRQGEGQPWLSAVEFDAGERLRRDFERAGLRARTTMDWSRASAGRGRGNAVAGEISDMAIDARRRIDAAMDCLEPALGGVALDICCHLKGLEQVETERRWPPRSAKLMLRTALSALARHYGLIARQGGAGLRHWGSADYSPRNLTPHQPAAPDEPPA